MIGYLELSRFKELLQESISSLNERVLKETEHTISWNIVNETLERDRMCLYEIKKILREEYLKYMDGNTKDTCGRNNGC